jgi:exopolysaccharide biosynthesis protein
MTHVVRRETSPRPVKMHLILIDLKARGIRFLVTPQRGPQDTVKQTVLQFLTEQKAQLTINAHFFEPWPAPEPDPGTADLVGLAASDGNVYSPFEANPPKQPAIQPNAPALNIDRGNHPFIVRRNPTDQTGKTVLERVALHNAVAGNEQILTGFRLTAGDGAWDNTPNPLTVIGLARHDTLILLLVDGRQPGVSEGLSTREAAALLRDDYGAIDALNLDGGGSTTLCMADPEPRVVNTPVGVNNVPGTLRPVGSSLAVFAARQPVAGDEPASR